MDEKETEIRVKRLYFVVDPKDLPDLARRILDGTLPIVVEWSYDQRRIKPTRAEVKRDPYGRAFIEVEGEVEPPPPTS